MFSKIIFALAMVCVVNASVLTASDDDPEIEVASNTKSCELRACEKLCRRLKLPGGACVRGRCKCDHFRNEEDEDDFSLSDLENSLSQQEYAVDEYPKLDRRRVCRLHKCGRACTSLGYKGATCIEDRCKCYNISKTFLPVSELSEDPTERGCNTQACDTLCRRLKFSGGACVNGHCKCNHIFGAEDAVDENSELATRRVCKLRQCSRTCARRGYETSRCVNGWCKCRNKTKIEDTSPLNDASSVENEESNDILTTNEEEPTAPDSRACNTVNCNQTCHRLKYAGGWCRFGHCRCY